MARISYYALLKNVEVHIFIFRHTDVKLYTTHW